MIENARHRGAWRCAWAVPALAALLAASGAQAACKYQRVGSVPVQWKNSRLVLEGAINDRPVTLVVDSGTTDVMLSHALAAKLDLGLWPVTIGGGRWTFSGIGGTTELWRTRVDRISFGPVQWKGAHVQVYGTASGDDDTLDALVGAGFLFQRDLELTGDAITFFEPAGCDGVALAYWADDVPWTTTEATMPNDLRVVVTVQVDGRPVRALVDTGAPVTVIDLPVARVLGFDAAKAGKGGEAGGFGTHTTRSWPATFQTFEIGDEIIRKPALLVQDMYGAYRQDVPHLGIEKETDEQPHMLLGADFLRAHRVLFATSQRRMYFSYLGGTVFGRHGDGQASAEAAPASAAAH